MVDSFQQALGQRLVDISEAIKRLKKDFAQKDDIKSVENKVSQNKLVLAETNKKIRELELNIKKTIQFTNALKGQSINIDELHLVHKRQDVLLKDFEEFKKKVDKDINYTYNDLLAVFRKFKKSLLSKEKKDIAHLEKIFKDFSKAYKDFKKQTTDYELKIEKRIADIKTKMEAELKENFYGFKEEMLGAVKKLQEKETKDNKLLAVQMQQLKLEVETSQEKFQKTTENYLYNLDREIETYVKKLRDEMKNVDVHSANQMHLLEKRFADIKSHLQANIKEQQKQIGKLNSELNDEKTSVTHEFKEFKNSFQEEFDHLSANLSNLNDVQIKLSKDDMMHHMDQISEKFREVAETNYKKLEHDLLHAEAENDKLKSTIVKQDKKIKAMEQKLLKRITKLEAKNKKK